MINNTVKALILSLFTVFVSNSTAQTTPDDQPQKQSGQSQSHANSENVGAALPGTQQSQATETETTHTGVSANKTASTNNQVTEEQNDKNTDKADELSESVKKELTPQFEIGPRTLDQLSPEAHAIRQKELLKGSKRPMKSYPSALKNFAYGVMASGPFSIRDMFNWLAWKVKVDEDITFDEVIESMDIKANDLNFKRVGENTFWKDVGAITGLPTSRVEVISYCDALVGRRMLDFSPEFSVFIPCRITVFEDYTGDIWIMTMDWNVAWIKNAWHPDSKLNNQLIDDAVRIRDAMAAIMEAGAKGEW